MGNRHEIDQHGLALQQITLKQGPASGVRMDDHVGERPFSAYKLAAYSAAVSAATIAIGLLWGAAGFL